ncbi:MAG TPA: flavodoxin family protein [Humidesulfovibrio sp.]|uniref:flavodoxin family protein n=1 Tax=Humidesulfovibrio sp. TaxID=2910988 RepID=UPI002C932604|nr:flavodoxin family protein [Humidesulfovibrio sp.]HWR03548.1 flavodoxin family protein [Humidesulfovibrio sp.]
MKVLGINGSARLNGNTAIMLNTALEEMAAEGFETELVQLGPKALQGCIACYKCFENKDKRCAVEDVMNEYIAKMLEADGILLGSPTYFADVTTNMKALMDRSGMVARANEDMFRRKAGAAVVTARRGGCIHTFDTLNHFFFIGQMVVPGSSYWNMGYGREPGQVRGDEEGMGTMRVLGRNMAWLLKKLAD